MFLLSASEQASGKGGEEPGSYGVRRRQKAAACLEELTGGEQGRCNGSPRPGPALQGNRPAE